MCIAARFARTGSIALLIVAPVSAAFAEDADPAAESKRWRYFFREVKVNQLLLELAERHRPTSLLIRDATILDLAGTAPLDGQFRLRRRA